MRTIVPGVRTLVLIIALGLSLQGKSQSITTGNGKIELGLGFGPLFFLGDLGGNAGTGKSALVGNFAKRFMNSHQNTVVITHFVGGRYTALDSKLLSHLKPTKHQRTLYALAFLQ